MSTTVQMAVERWRQQNMPGSTLGSDPAPSSLNEAQDWRSAAVIEQKELEAKLAVASHSEIRSLKARITSTSARISVLNDWIAKARRHSPMRAAVPISSPVLTPEVAATLATKVPDFPNRCVCGEEVVPERTRESWVFYCQRCGADWSAPAPREPLKPKPRTAAKRCTCAHQCRICGGERR